MGGGGTSVGGTTTVQQPTPPPHPSLTSTMAEYTAAMPQMYQTQLQYAPQFAQLAYNMANQLYPQTAALPETMAQTATQGMQSQVPDWMQNQYQSNLNANLGTNVGSPIGADYVSTGMMNQQQQWQQYYQNMAMSLAGQQQVAPTQTMDLYGGYNPQSAMSYANQGYQNYSGLYGNMYGANANLQGSQNQMWGNIIGGGLGGIGAAIGSSITYKENINDNDIDTLGILKDLHIVTYNYKPEIENSGKKRIGVLAEEIPELLKTEDGLGVDIPNTIGLLLDVNKKLIQRIEKLEVLNGKI